jgi:hypothetical protein
VIIIPDGHEPPIDAGHRIELTSGTPQAARVRRRAAGLLCAACSRYPLSGARSHSPAFRS